MTVQEMHQAFKLEYDKTDSLNYPNFLPEEIDHFLNNAQEKFIEQRAYGTNPKRDGLEETQKRMDDLRNIIKNYSSSTFTQTANNKVNGYFVTLPADYRHAIEEEIKVNYIDCTGVTETKTSEVIPITHDRYNRTNKDPFNRAYEDQIHRLNYQGDVFELLFDSTTTPNTYKLRYLKNPQTIQYGTAYATPSTDVNCELATHTHREIVAIAVRDALENIQSQRLGTNNQLLNTTE